jgi:RNA polymerase subunit RPABC4/transcription elongation factor Spt4
MRGVLLLAGCFRCVIIAAMQLPSLETIISYSTICFSVLGALLAAVWLSLVIWTFRDMRLRSRDPFAQLLAAVVVATLPGAGLIVYLILRPPETLAEAYERALEEEALLQEIEERPACPGCSRTVQPNWILCPHCHTRLRKVCPDCNALMELQWNLCPFCGNHFVDPYRAEPPAAITYPESPSLASTSEAAEMEEMETANRPTVPIQPLPSRSDEAPPETAL